MNRSTKQKGHNPPGKPRARERSQNRGGEDEKLHRLGHGGTDGEVVAAPARKKAEGEKKKKKGQRRSKGKDGLENGEIRELFGRGIERRKEKKG